MEAIERDIKEIKGMLSDLSELMLKVLDMEIEPVRGEDLTEDEKEEIKEILEGRAELLTKDEFEKSISK